MSALLVCPKGKGNTYDVSRYVADNSGAALLVINQDEGNDLREYTSIILCSGVYLDKVHQGLLGWLGQVKKTSIHENAKFYMFLTWFGRGQSHKNAIKAVKYILGEHKINLENDYIACYGGKGIIRYGHPNKEDCEKILDWVRQKTK